MLRNQILQIVGETWPMILICMVTIITLRIMYIFKNKIKIEFGGSNMSKTLIVYYSHSGNTKKVAQEIQQITGGELFQVKPRIPYPTSYNAVVEQAKKEIAKNFLPELENGKINIEQ